MSSASATRVFLIGPMGSGKSAVGKVLAKLRRLPFYDSDHEIERRTGVDIPLIFEKEGEAGFRQRERDVIDELTQLPELILSTGGGAILLEANRQALRERGFVVYLRTSVAQQAQRVREGHNRPLLAGADPATRLAQLMTERESLYASTAHFSIDTDRRHVRAVAQQILRELER